jgi:hypothetical protein
MLNSKAKKITVWIAKFDDWSYVYVLVVFE